MSSMAVVAAAAIFTAAMVRVGAWAPAETIPANKNPEEEQGEKLVKASDCSSCHAIDHQEVGPAYSAVAKRYAGQPDAVEKLAMRIREGGSGNWGKVAMTPHPDLAAAPLRAMVQWILSLKDRVAVQSEPAPKIYTYTIKNGETVKLDFPLFVERKDPRVTKDVFRGYELYNSYCFRCHGQDGVGGELAPDLRRSLGAGMAFQEFLSAAMAGRKDKGMPSWAGFFTEEEVRQIFEYLKGRSLDLVPVGRPPSEMD